MDVSLRPLAANLQPALTLLLEEVEHPTRFKPCVIPIQLASVIKITSPSARLQDNRLTSAQFARFFDLERRERRLDIYGS
jgi:hypothetical protein